MYQISLEHNLEKGVLFETQIDKTSQAEKNICILTVLYTGDNGRVQPKQTLKHQLIFSILLLSDFTNGQGCWQETQYINY